MVPASRASAAPPITITDGDLRCAFRACKLVGMTFEQALDHPALSVVLRTMAASAIRRQQRLASLQRLDRKRAQANDSFDHEPD